MFYKKICTLIIFMIVFFQSQSIFAFTIINQTDSEKILKIQEAYRPVSEGNLNAPVPIGHLPHEITVPSKSVYYLDLVEPCPVLLVGVKTIVEEMETDTGRFCRTTTTTTCYEPYECGDQKESLINDGWGLVIHNPILNPNLGNSFSPNYFVKKHQWEQTKKQGYGIKCLHPKLLEKVNSLDELPEDLN